MHSSRRAGWDEVGLECYDWSEETCRLWADCSDNMPGDDAWSESNIDADSEALEACARIWEQHLVRHADS